MSTAKPLPSPALGVKAPQTKRQAPGIGLQTPGGVVCIWKETEDGRHDTQCGEAFEFTNDGVKANGFKFCPFCGKQIKTVQRDRGADLRVPP